MENFLKVASKNQKDVETDSRRCENFKISLGSPTSDQPEFQKEPTDKLRGGYYQRNNKSSQNWGKWASRLNGFTPRQIIMKFQDLRNNETILKTSREKM